MQPQSALIGADRTVELHAETAINLNTTLIIDPGYPEYDLPLRLDNPVENPCANPFGMLLRDWIQALKDFQDSLMKFLFVGIAFDHLMIGAIESIHCAASCSVIAKTIIPKGFSADFQESAFSIVCKHKADVKHFMQVM
jgi:hypothetical protein